MEWLVEPTSIEDPRPNLFPFVQQGEDDYEVLISPDPSCEPGVTYEGVLRGTVTDDNGNELVRDLPVAVTIEGEAGAEITIFSIEDGFESEILGTASTTGLEDLIAIPPTIADLYEVETGDPWDGVSQIVPEGVVYDQAHWYYGNASSTHEFTVTVRSYGADISDLSVSISGPDAGNYTVNTSSFSGVDGTITFDVSTPSEEGPAYEAEIEITVTLADSSVGVVTLYPTYQQVFF